MKNPLVLLLPAVLPAVLPAALPALLAGSSLACAGKRPDPTTEVKDPLPVLPAQVGEVYARGQGTPGDALVAIALGGRPWDESLSGAAGALALQPDGGLSLAQAQWAAWRAGYPFPVVLGAVDTAEGRTPPESVATVVAERVGAGEDLGLARARHGEQDRWVALVGRPLAGVPAFARQYSVGERLQVGLSAEVRWVVVSPEGVPQEGTGPVDVALGEEGEWWLDASLPAGRLSLPIYAGMDMPAQPVVALPGSRPSSPSDAVARLYAVLDQVRADFELSSLAADPVLETLAVSPLEHLDQGAWVQAEEVQRLRAAGFVSGSADQVWCEASTVELCVEGLMRTAQGRVAILDPGHRLVGAAAVVGTSGAVIVVNLAGEG